MIHHLVKYNWDEELHFLLDNMDQDELEMILHKDVDEGRSPLQLACSFGNYSAAEKLSNYYDHFEDGPYHPILLAKEKGYKELEQLMRTNFSTDMSKIWCQNPTWKSDLCAKFLFSLKLWSYEVWLCFPEH